ncbi:MAG: tyrosine-type recombinase/integrase [Promethearchaeota archaeon]
MNKPSNKEIIEKYLNHYQHSKESIKTRKSALNYFFNSKYFGYDGHVFEINTDTLIDYFDYLKHLKTITLETKKNKWKLLISFLNFCMEYYRKHNFIVIVPKHSINWNGIPHKEPQTNKNVVLTKKELETILNHLKLTHFQYYLIFRIFAETGMRKSELINIDYNKVNIEKRYIITWGKTGKKVYYISQDLASFLKIYINERKLIDTDTKALFISTRKKRYSKRQFNAYLKVVLNELNEKNELNTKGKSITCHTFRRSLNTFRKLMGCPNEDRKILLNHRVQDVNINSYVKLNYEQYIKLFDKWYPYRDIQI